MLIAFRYRVNHQLKMQLVSRTDLTKVKIFTTLIRVLSENIWDKSSYIYFTVQCTVSCPTNWVLGPNQTKCFAYFRNSTSWEKSETLCIASGGHLASLSSNKELSFVQKLCNANATSCWIGGRSLNSSTVGFNWTWSDPKTPQWNQTMFPKVPVRTPCRNGSSSCGADICMVLTNGSLQVFGERCNASHAFICSVDSGNNTPLSHYS